ncbi:cell division protein ZapE [Litorilituus lipolyticus]|uniref:Cell division protein ZapE n=1 Tax=Litorilituus lipolyticus TaxID=2491017 RepID=A0A502KZZ2_9GAMM|nr:cell division protein ZapE [Litorilituus lipolyticus]TPH17202.1 cell division protein ZapE [Litorilituus lipolyticus]
MKVAYQQKIEEGELDIDTAQLLAVEALDNLIHDIEQHDKAVQTPTFPFSSLKTRLSSYFFSHSIYPEVNTPIKGLYFHGRVGRGKTMLMDLFYQKLTTPRKRRIHFYRFMADVHHQLAIISARDKHKINPLEKIAKRWALDVQVLCFDEFFVADIGDAMILAGLFEALFNNGVIIVATSNCHPEKLYKNGLQRERFIPTIEQIQKHCHIISIDGDTDHRLTHDETDIDKRYFSVAEQGNKKIAQYFNSLMLREENIEHNHCIEVNNREIKFICRTGKLIWFDFFDLCSGPRSQLDYINIANEYQIVFISNIPQFSGKTLSKVASGVEDSYQRKGHFLDQLQALDDEARRFIALVDEFYDRNIQLIVSAAVPIDQLYKGQELAFEFARCQSRLHEMQSINY